LNDRSTVRRDIGWLKVTAIVALTGTRSPAGSADSTKGAPA
jgi:hypothetical protein